MLVAPNLSRTVVKNAWANLARLTGSGIVALLLSPFLVRALAKDVFGAWSLLLQLTLYVTYLDFGIQTAVSRFVAHAEELGDSKQRDGIVSTAFAMLSCAALLGCVLVVVLAWQLPNLFRQMPPALYPAAQLALLAMGVSFAIGLPVSVIHALFIGLQRNEIPAFLAISNKIAMAALVVGVVLKHEGLAAMGIGVAAANLLSYMGAFAAWRAWAHRVCLRLASVSRFYARQIAGYSASVVVWMLAMLLISGLDLSIVGIFDYKMMAYYAIAATLSNFVAQAQGAIFSALLPASAVLGARGDGERLGRILVVSTRYGMLILLSMALPLVVAGYWILRIWAGADYAQHSTLILQVLVIANVVRLCALPYSTLLLGTGQQRKVIASPLAEGITNLVTSLAGAYLFGAIGVAIGTLIGAFVSVGLHVFYNMPRTALIVIDRIRLIKEGLLRPLVCVAPFGLLLIGGPRDLSGYVLALTVATVTAVLLFWKFGLLASERERVAQVLHLS
ncbi:MAG TPA: polysaccharide biosynthesis C-terminal domain-containing protein [Terriglobales bacterium]|jgi:O-antigen/teichoic acid export membrane protein|nr:polysaccharide biosynthesis C-terminal domain-containing protein [Terriglobales bacterium]